MHTALKVFLLVICLIILVEIIALLWLYLSVGKYKNYWAEKSSEQGEFTYLALGDSAAQGIGASSPMRGYVGLLAEHISQKTGKQVKIVNLSVTGAKINDVSSKQLFQSKDIKPDLITVEIGANDIGEFNEVKFESDFKQLLSKLPKGTYISNMPYFGSRKKLQPKAEQASSIIQKLVNDNKNFHLVDLQTITKKHDSIFNYAPDYFHPNNLGYKNWSEAFWKEIESKLNKSE